MKDGTHLILDLKECKNVDNLSNERFIKNLILDLIKITGMKAITKPSVLYYEHKEKKESGITGFVIISDSHTSIHAYPFKKSLYLDLFSCRNFGSKEIINCIKEIFKPEKLTKRIIRR